MMWPALALLLLAGGGLSAPTHALVPGDDGPPSVLRTNDAQHPRQHTAISALLPNDHERTRVSFWCKKTRYNSGNNKRIGLFGGVWRQGEADSVHGIRFLHKRIQRATGTRWTRWYLPTLVHGVPRGGVLEMNVNDGTGDYLRIEMDRLKYNRREAQEMAQLVYGILGPLWSSRLRPRMNRYLNGPDE